MQIASYLANIAFEGIYGFIAGELISSKYATVMHDANWGHGSMVIGQWVGMMKPSVLAVDTPSGAALGTFLQIIFYLVAGGVGVKVLFGKKPTHAELATKKELAEELSKKADKTELKRIEDEVKQLDKDLDAAGEKILNKLDEVKDDISAELKEFSNEASKGRAAIWNKVNKDAERITAVEASKS